MNRLRNTIITIKEINEAIAGIYKENPENRANQVNKIIEVCWKVRNFATRFIYPKPSRKEIKGDINKLIDVKKHKVINE